MSLHDHASTRAPGHAGREWSRGQSVQSVQSVQSGQSGQSMTEYLVALAVATAVVVAAGVGEPSALQLFLLAVQTAWGRLLTAVALPL
jgi:hypothetical protein